MVSPTQFFFLCCLVCAAPAQAAEAIDGNQLRLDDGRILRLAGILAPADKTTTAYLQSLIDGQTLTLDPKEPIAEPDGRIVADVKAGTQSIAARLIEEGRARVYPSLPGAAALLPLEITARQDCKGLWNDKAYRILPAAEASRALNSYALVEGTILNTAQIKGRTFLNFGINGTDNWREDFTIELDKNTARQIDWAHLGGQPVRVRGWVDWNFGPHILVTDPAQLELTAMAN